MKARDTTRIAALMIVLIAIGTRWVSPEHASARRIQNEVTADATVAALVNGERVMRADVQRLLASPVERGQLLQELGVEQTDDETLERLAVQKLINRRLLLQEAARRNITITEQELDKALVSWRRRFEDLRSFGAWMKQQGLDDKSLFETIRAEMLAARVTAALTAPVHVTDEEVQQYYEAHKEDLKVEEVRLQIIVVDDEASAIEILSALQNGEAFGTLARKKSIGQRASKGGDAGWIDSATLWPPLRDIVRTMKPRDAGGPLQRGAQFLVVRLDGRRPGRTKSLAEARPDIEKRLLLSKHQQAIRIWLNEQEKKSTIEVFPGPTFPRQPPS